MKNNNEEFKIVIEDEQSEKTYEVIYKMPEWEHFLHVENNGASTILEFYGTMHPDEIKLLHSEPCGLLCENITGNEVNTFNNYLEFPITCFLVSSMQIYSFECGKTYYFMTEDYNSYYFEISEKSEAFSMIVSNDRDLADMHYTVKIHGVAKENARYALEDFDEYILDDKARWNF